MKTDVKIRVLEAVKTGLYMHSFGVAQAAGLPEPSVRRALLALVRARKIRRERCTLGGNKFDYRPL